jgi:hypothetical protein
LKAHYADPYERETARSKLQSLRMEDGSAGQLDEFRQYRDAFLDYTAAAGRTTGDPAVEEDHVYDFTKGLTPYLAKGVYQTIDMAADFNQFARQVEVIVRGNERLYHMHPPRPRAQGLTSGNRDSSAAQEPRASGGQSGTGGSDRNGRGFPREVPADVIAARRIRRAGLRCGKTGHAYIACRSGAALSDEGPVPIARADLQQGETQPEAEAFSDQAGNEGARGIVAPRVCLGTRFESMCRWRH